MRSPDRSIVLRAGIVAPIEALSSCGVWKSADLRNQARTALRRSSMTKRNAHARQRKYTKLLARATALTSAVRHFGQAVTGRSPWSLGLGMLERLSRTECASSATNDSRQVAGVGAGCSAEVVGSDPFRQPGGLHSVGNQIREPVPDNARVFRENRAGQSSEVDRGPRMFIVGGALGVTADGREGVRIRLAAPCWGGM